MGAHVSVRLPCLRVVLLKRFRPAEIHPQWCVCVFAASCSTTDLRFATVRALSPLIDFLTSFAGCKRTFAELWRLKVGPLKAATPLWRQPASLIVSHAAGLLLMHRQAGFDAIVACQGDRVGTLLGCC